MSGQEGTPPRGLNARQKIVVILMDAALLAELSLSIYLGRQDPENMTAVFLKAFIPMVIGTLIAARILVKRNATPQPEFAETRAVDPSPIRLTGEFKKT
jgi:hypothetical protein